MYKTLSYLGECNNPCASIQCLQRPLLFSLQHHHDTHQTQHDLLEPWILAQENCDISYERNEADYASYDVFLAVEKRLAGGIELGVICDVVVALREEAERCFAALLLVSHFQNIMHFQLNAIPTQKHSSFQAPQTR